MSGGVPILRRADSVSWHSMRSWVLVLLLAWLPLQSALATIFVYCQREAEAGSRPRGASRASSRSRCRGQAHDGGSAARGPQQVDDNDCGYCHLSRAQPLAFAAEPGSATATSSSTPSALYLRHPRARGPRTAQMAGARPFGEPRGAAHHLTPLARRTVPSVNEESSCDRKRWPCWPRCGCRVGSRRSR